jgi:hypothetical protein
VTLFENPPSSQVLQASDSDNDLLDTSNQLILLDVLPETTRVVYTVIRNVLLPHLRRAMGILPFQSSLPSEPIAALRKRAALARLFFGCFLVLLGAFYLTHLREGHVWGDDFAMYIAQAKNIALGHPLADTGYIFNPHRPVLGPSAYPPVFPLLLSPVYRIWGLNLAIMKTEIVLIFLLALFLAFELISVSLTHAYSAVLVAILGCSPYFYEIKDNVTSDLPFLCFVMLSLLVLSRCEIQGWRSVPLALSASICVYLSFATRTAGVSLLGCLILSSIQQRGASARNAAISALSAMTLMAIHSAVFGGNGSYLAQVHIPLYGVVQNGIVYGWSLYRYVLGIRNAVVGGAFLLLLGALGSAGIVHRLRIRVSYLEVFTVSYALIILLWTSENDGRLLVPLLPMWLLYIGVALRQLQFSHKRAVCGMIVVCVGVAFVSRYSRISDGPIREGLGDASFVRTCEYIRSSTPKDSVLVFSKPRLLALVTERKASTYDTPHNDGELWEDFTSIRARYVLVNRQFADDREYLEPLILRNAAHAHEIFAEAQYHLYEIL